MDANKKSLVIQSNNLIEARYRLSVEEQKLIKVLISKIQTNDVNFKEYEFRIKELGEILGITHNEQYSVIKRITERLITRGLSFYNSETKRFLQTSWLSSAEYEEGKGIVALCFDPKLQPLLLQLKSYFTKYDMEQIMRFRGQYTIRFFEFRKSFIGRNKNEVTFTLKELREILGLKKDEYDQFFDFKRRVVEPARLELLEKTGKSFTWEPIKQGRGGKIVSVHFIFDGDAEATPNEVTQAPPKTAETPVEHSLPDELQDLFKELLRLGIVNKAAQEMVNQHTPNQLRAAMTLTNQQTDLQNPAGFLVEALNGDWRDPHLEQVNQQRQKRQQQEDTEARKKRLQQLKRRFSEYRLAAAQEAYPQVEVLLVQQWKEEFIQTQPPILRNRVQGKEFGFENPRFRAFVMQRLSLPTLEDFLEQEGVQLQEDERTGWNQL